MKCRARDVFLEKAIASGFALLLVLVGLGCERPPMEAEQGGYRGLAMEQVSNPREFGATLAANEVPAPQPPTPEGTAPSTAVFQNVPVLGHLSSGDFTRLMLAMTSWVSPDQGCLYCHDGSGFEKDMPYTKLVARRMIQMTQSINSEWKDHVGDTGVTCYTCHRGMPVPANYWYKPHGEPGALGPAGSKHGQNAPAQMVGLTSLPNDPFSAYLLNDENIRVQSTEALPSGNLNSIKQTEWTYGFMVHLSTSLGVNCTYCHNSRSFGPWEASTPARVKAWYGIRMVRDLNESYLGPLASVMPAERKGPHGDSFKVNCATCHQGVSKPLLGVSMLQDYPSLGAPRPTEMTRLDQERTAQ